MYLKGEGTDANHTKAVELYELAAKENHVRALNGLGYVYFNGHVLPQNFVSCGTFGLLSSSSRRFALLPSSLSCGGMRKVLPGK